MNSFDAYSMCQRHLNQYVHVKTTDGKTHNGYIGNVDQEKVYLAIPEEGSRGGDSTERSCGCHPKPRYPVSPAYYPPYRPCPPYYPVSPAYYPPRTRPRCQYPYPAPYPVPPYPVRRAGWRWIAIPLAFLVGLGVGTFIR